MIFFFFLLISFQGYGLFFKIFKRNMIYHGPSFQGLLDRFPRLVIKDLVLLVRFCDCKEGGEHFYVFMYFRPPSFGSLVCDVFLCFVTFPYISGVVLDCIDS